MKNDRGILKSNSYFKRNQKTQKIQLRMSEGTQDKNGRISFRTQDTSNLTSLRKSQGSPIRQEQRQNSLFGSRKRLKCMIPSQSVPRIDNSHKCIRQLRRLPPLKQKKILKYEGEPIDKYTIHMHNNLQQNLDVNKPIIIKNGKPLHQDCCTIY